MIASMVVPVLAASIFPSRQTDSGRVDSHDLFALAARLLLACRGGCVGWRLTAPLPGGRKRRLLTSRLAPFFLPESKSDRASLSSPVSRGGVARPYYENDCP